MAKTVDIKISFQTFNCQPGREEYDKFERNLFAHGGTCDNEGWSLADCLMRTDDGAVDAAGNPMPGVTAIPAAGGGNQGKGAGGFPIVFGCSFLSDTYRDVF